MGRVSCFQYFSSNYCITSFLSFNEKLHKFRYSAIRNTILAGYGRCRCRYTIVVIVIFAVIIIVVVFVVVFVVIFRSSTQSVTVLCLKYKNKSKKMKYFTKRIFKKRIDKHFIIDWNIFHD
uniref:Uncharacterized protein n=1 Tax=Glossina brevipalpis TaxID=37001 RepID=A0A1A9WJP2_9MUSC